MHFYPNYFDNYRLTQKMNEYIFSLERLDYSDLERFMKSGWKPDIISLRSACRVLNNSKVIEHLMSVGIKPDLECVKNIFQVHNLGTVGTVLISFLETKY